MVDNSIVFQGNDTLFYSQKNEILSFKSYAGMQRTTEQIVNDAAAQMDMPSEEALVYIKILKGEACLNEQSLKDVSNDFMEKRGIPFALVQYIRRVLMKPRGFEHFSELTRTRWGFLDDARILGQLQFGTKVNNDGTYTGEFDINGYKHGLGEMTYQDGSIAKGMFIDNMFNGYRKLPFVNN